eukprot:CAMPEP_0172326848 /NCGR_PEP_ID=MMETSP1058-20130122/57755_1 /TAXON_ID=83371 /ORGANISM="Detonula confervacea, Strain CCMP 353" /LENGTH=829 /DNA_ID=CAMNT_0013043737 /DNA_START=140 /DNA_END=2629 /DNA_ORIENTATION=-
MAAFALSNMNPSSNLQKLMRSSSRPSIQSHCRKAFFPSCPRYSSVLSSMKSSPSKSSSDNYYSVATGISALSTTSSASSLLPPPDKSFPDWWPVSDSIQNYLAFADHIAHVIVPDTTNEEGDIGDGIVENKEVLTCEEVVEWVLRAERDRHPDSQSIHSNLSAVEGIALDHDSRRLRIEAEWKVGETVSTPLKVLDPAYRHDPCLLPQNTSSTQPNLTAAELFALGSVWHLPYSSTKPTIDRFDPSNGIKPTRLNAGDWNKTAQPGDYFRVHFDPRRFVDTNLYDWGTADGDFGGSDNKPGVVVARDDEAGYFIINKPPNIPVHARVDNFLENVAASVGRTLWRERKESILLDMEAASCDKMKDDDLIIYYNATNSNSTDTRTKVRKHRRKSGKQKKENLVYVATPQRLDQNTSGLLVVASKKSFAAYFAKLLRTKTSGQLQRGGSSRSSSCGIHKTYTCVVCIMPQNVPGGATPASMASEIDRLKEYTIMKHFLEPSIRAPKRFVPTVPDDVDNAESWAECLLKITNIAEVCTVVGNAPSNALAKSLFGEYGKPDDCIAVAELEIELLTGRTHQIRGQLAAEGFPLVGDVQYGGAVPNSSPEMKERCKGRAESFLDSERLALQCCSLEFLDPEYDVKSDGSDKVKRSERWNSFRLDDAFWTPFVGKYRTAEIASTEATSSLNVEAPLLKQAITSVGLHSDALRTRDLPPRVLLSQGSNKYVVVRAVLLEGSDNNNEEWFVRSASPEECGGPYHANVGEGILHQLQSLGYTTTVMGGGRIDFVKDETVSHAHVFGFSYGFGKGDHEKVAAIIEKNTNISATFDSSDGLY